MTIVTSLARVSGHVATVVHAATLAAWSHRPALQWPDRAAEELVRLDAGFQTSLRTQLEAARRYDRCFTLTSTALGGGDLELDPAQVAQACERHIRVLDAVTLMDDVLVLLWGGTEQPEAATALERLIAAGVLPPLSLERTGSATFPADGLTAVSLTEAAADRVGSLVPAGREQPTRPRAVSTARSTARSTVRSTVRVGRSRANGDELTAVGR